MTRSAAVIRSPSRLVPALVLGVLAAGAHANGLGNPWVYDDGNLMRDQSLRALSRPMAIIEHSRRPVTHFTYAFNYAFSGLRPLGYHLVNLAIHVACVLLVYALCLRLWRDHAARRGGAGGEADADDDADADAGEAATPAQAWASFAIAGVFAVHPMLTEAVGYVSSRPGLLALLFVLGSLLWMRQGIRQGRTAPKVAALASFALALGSKETAAALPFVLWAYDELLLPSSAAARTRRRLRLHVPLCALMVLGGAVRVLSYVKLEKAPPWPWHVYVLTQAGVLWRYLLMLVLPIGQTIAHEITAVRSLGSWRVLVPAAGLCLLAFAIWRQRRRAPLVAFGAVWFALFLLPTSLIPLRDHMAEHRVYEASPGFFLAVASLLVGERMRLGAARARLLWGGCAVVLLALTAATIARNHVWGDSVRLWQDAAAKAPDKPAPHYGLADALVVEERFGEAADEYRKVIELLPKSQPRLWTELAVALARAQRLDEAKAAFERALALQPRSVDTLYNLGALETNRRRYREAAQYFRKVLEIDPRQVEARRVLAFFARAYFGDRQAALAMCREIETVAGDRGHAAECIRNAETDAATP